MTQTILILGATSDIARAVARLYAPDRPHLILAARTPEALNADIADLTTRGAATCRAIGFDVCALDTHESLVASLGVLPDIVICAVGALGAQAADEKNLTAARSILETNFTGPALLLSNFANAFEARGSGTIVGISSVAGDRGRASNYLYGSAKAGFSEFLSGLRNRLAKKGVHVVTVKPGFVRTRMTEGMKLPAPLTATPERVALAIREAIVNRSDTMYVLPIWRLIMLIICCIPERLFKKMLL